LPTLIFRPAMIALGPGAAICLYTALTSLNKDLARFIRDFAPRILYNESATGKVAVTTALTFNLA
jgi:hypothetical protein